MAKKQLCRTVPNQLKISFPTHSESQVFCKLDNFWAAWKHNVYDGLSYKKELVNFIGIVHFFEVWGYKNELNVNQNRMPIIFMKRVNISWYHFPFRLEYVLFFLRLNATVLRLKVPFWSSELTNTDLETSEFLWLFKWKTLSPEFFPVNLDTGLSINIVSLFLLTWLHATLPANIRIRQRWRTATNNSWLRFGIY